MWAKGTFWWQSSFQLPEVCRKPCIYLAFPAPGSGLRYSPGPAWPKSWRHTQHPSCGLLSSPSLLSVMATYLIFNLRPSRSVVSTHLPCWPNFPDAKWFQTLPRRAEEDTRCSALYWGIIRDGEEGQVCILYQGTHSPYRSVGRRRNYQHSILSDMLKPSFFYVT